MQITKLKITELDKNKNDFMYIIYQLSVEEEVPTIVLKKGKQTKTCLSSDIQNGLLQFKL